MSVQVRVQAPYPIWGEVPSPENIARFHARWNKEGVSYTKLPVARWVEMACKAPLLAARLALTAGMTGEIRDEMIEAHTGLQEDFKTRVMGALEARCAEYDRMYPGFVGSFVLEKSITDRLRAEVLADDRWKQEYASLETRLRDWLMDHQAEAGAWLDRSRTGSPVSVVSHTFTA